MVTISDGFSLKNASTSLNVLIAGCWGTQGKKKHAYTVTLQNLGMQKQL